MRGLWLGIFGIMLQVQGQDIIWQRYLGGTGFDTGKEIRICEGGALLIAGDTFSKNGLGVQNHGLSGDIFIRKFSTQGTIFWQRTLGGLGIEELADLEATPDGGWVLLGTTDSEEGDPGLGKGLMDMWLVKLDANGAMEWNKRYGGSGNDQGFSILPLANGDYLIGGASGSRNGDMETCFHHGGVDGWVALLDSKGEIKWSRLLGGSQYDKVVRLHQNANEYWVIAVSSSHDGDIRTQTGDKDVQIFRLDPKGEILGQIQVGGENADEIYDSRLLADGKLLMAGTTFSGTGYIGESKGQGDAWVCMVQADGQVLWSRTYGGTRADGFNRIIPLRGGGYMAVGLTKSKDLDIPAPIKGFYDALMCRLDAEGNLQACNNFGNNAKDAFFDVQESPDGGYLLIGYSEKPYLEEKPTLPPYIGGVDIWLCNISDPQQKKFNPFVSTTSLEGKIYQKNSSKTINASVALLRDTGDTLAQVGTQGNGAFVLPIASYGRARLEVQAQGFFFYSREMLLDTLRLKSKVYRKVELEPIVKNKPFILRGLSFETGNWELTAESEPELRRLLAFLQLHPRLYVEIGGHTDNTGDTADKERLSLLRAVTVRSYLIDSGIDPNRLEVLAYGMEKPIASNDTEEGRMLNRRVELKVLDNL